MQKLFIPCLLTLSLSLLTPVSSHAADASFDISGSSSKAQSLDGGETGTVELNSNITSSADSVVITVDNKTNPSSSPIVITNRGTISDTDADTDQSGRDIRITGTGVTLTINNASTGTIETANADVIQEGKGITDSNITINNSGIIDAENTLSTQSKYYGDGQQGLDLGNDVTGTVTINNYTGGTLEALDSDAIQSAANAHIYNDGTIESTEPAGDTSGNDGIDAQTNSGVTIVNGSAIMGDTASSALISGARHGITGGNITTGVYSMTITNNSGATIQGNDGSGINIDGINGSELVTVTNHGTITGNGVSGDGDGVDVDGLVNIDNFGTIQSLDAYQDASEGVTVGGGTIKNELGAKIIGYDNSNTAGEVGVGITLAGIDKDANDNPIPIQTIYGATTVDNYGTIQGTTSAGIRATSLADQYNIIITNEAGATIEGGGTISAAIQMDGVADQIGSTVANKVIDYGTITADASGKAIDLGAGTNEVDIEGGAAQVNGSISGGTGSTNSVFKVDAGSGNSFVYSGAISNFTTLSVASGTFNYGGTITGGTTTIQNGATLAGNNTVGALIIAAGGTLSPGNSPGKTTASSAVLNPTGNFLLQVDNDGSTGAAGTNWDQLAVTGTVDISALGSGSGNQFVFDLQSLNSSDAAGALASFNHDVSHVWTDVITSAGLTGSFSSSDFAVDTSLFNEALDGSFSIQQDATNSNDLDLVYTAAPEPSTWALLFSGAGLLAGFARFRSRFV